MIKIMSNGIAMAAALFLATGVAFGQDNEVAKLKKEMERQYNNMLKMQLKLAELEKKQNDQGSLLEQVQKGGESIFSLARGGALKFSGDFRYRHEMIDEDGDSDRHRHRIRARIGLDAKVNDELDFSVRIATGGDDPVSTNQTLTGSFTSKELWLDRAYLKWRPEYFGGAAVQAGKMGTPFVAVGKNQLVWDGDLSPEGIAAKYDCDLAEGLNAFVSGGGFWLREHGDDADVSLWGVQGGLKREFGDGNHITGGVGYFDYGNVENHTALYDGSFFGNSNDGAMYTNDYNMIELFGEISSKIGSIPVSAYGEYVTNSAGAGGNTGWLAGVKINKCKAPGSWDAGYNYREIQEDAVFGLVTDSDFIGGGTNGRGHKFTFGYQIARNFQAGITYLMNDKHDADTDYDRMQLDLKLKF